VISLGLLGQVPCSSYSIPRLPIHTFPLDLQDIIAELNRLADYYKATLVACQFVLELEWDRDEEGYLHEERNVFCVEFQQNIIFINIIIIDLFHFFTF
jgi:hypothetical protein